MMTGAVGNLPSSWMPERRPPSNVDAGKLKVSELEKPSIQVQRRGELSATENRAMLSVASCNIAGFAPRLTKLLAVS